MATQTTRQAALGLALAVAVSLPALAQAPRGKASVDELVAQLDQVARQIEAARNNIDLVEKQYTLRAEPSDEAARLQRFSDGEIQYLLGDYSTAAVLFYDLVANKEFQSSPRFADALFYLSDSLYQQKNYLGARLYLKQLLALRGAHYKEALARFLEIAGRVNEFHGIDEYMAQAKGLSGGALPPELTYVYAKWLFRRDDISLEDRVNRAQGIFATLAADATGPFRLQSAYFIGVGFVRLRQWDKAIEQFKAVTAMPPRDEKDKQVQELANLSLGRVLFEAGRFDEAVDRYQEVSRESDNFPDALYETAWTYVRKNQLQQAKNATEILLLVAEESVLAPEAKILQGTLLQKLQKYDEAIDTYTTVINTYAPVRDEIDALLTVNKDPVQYFDELLARNEKSLDVTKLLPPVALKWASTRKEVADAQEITSALEASRQGLKESRLIADRILKSVSERGLESFPMLQEGFTRADAVETSITRSEESLTRIEGYLVSSLMAPEQRQQLDDLRARGKALRERLASMPTTSEELLARRQKIQAKIDEVDRQAFQLGIEIQAQAAQLTAIRKYVDDTRTQRKTSPEDEQAFLERVSTEQRALEAMQTELEELRANLAAERNNADKAVSGEDTLRAEYNDVLAKERALYQAVRGQLPGEAQKAMLRADVVRADALAVRDRVGRSKAVIRERVQQRIDKLLALVMAEQKLIDTYSKDTDRVTGETRNLVGRIAFDSFKRVRQSFYDLVLKADVGVVDVAFQRKQDKTSSIQDLARRKDQELKQLDEEFKEVLKDVE